MPYKPGFLHDPPEQPIRLAPESVGESKRARILKAMIEACAERGYNEVDVADVVARARVSRSTFDEHFADKEDCYLGAYRVMYDRFFAGVAENAAARAADPPDTFEGAFRWVMVDYFAAVAEDPGLAHAFNVDMYAVGPAPVAMRMEGNRRTAELITAVHEHYGGRPLDTHEAEFIVNIIVGLVTNHLAVGDAHKLPGLAEPLARTVAAWLA